MNWGVGWSIVAGILSSSIVSGLAQAVLNHRYSTKLESLKKDFSLELFERQTKFAWLHNERSRVLVRLYRLLWRVDKLFNDMTRPVQFTNDELTKAGREKASKAANTFFDFYQKNRVLLDDNLVTTLQQIEEEYRRVWAEFVPFDNSKPDPQSWAESWKKVGEIGLIFTKIRQQVQGMLGVDTHFKRSGIAMDSMRG